MLSALAACGLAALACSAAFFRGEAATPLGETPPPGTQTSSATPEASPEQEATAGAATLLPGEIAACVSPSDPIFPSRPPFAEYGAFFLSYLSAGGSPAQLRDQLVAWDMIRESPGQLGASSGLVEGGLDFNADGLEDVAVVVLDLDADPALLQTPTPPMSLYLYECAGPGSGFELAHTYFGGSLGSGPDSALEVHALDDLTGESRDIVVFSTVYCGAHTCWYGIQGLQVDPATGEFVPLFAETIEVPYPIVLIEDIDGSGPAEIVIDTGAIGSAGAGPQRTYRDTYTWDPAERIYTRTSHVLTSSQHPIHLVNDADALLLAGDYRAAADLYVQSYSDPTLDRSWDMFESWQAELEAYARYRTLLAFVLLGDSDTAQVVHDDLMAHFPNGAAPGGTFAGYATTFWTAYGRTGSAREGCAAVLATLDTETFASQMPLNMFGYANRYYGDAAEMCPVP
jgi:hypothetical protein